MVSQRRTTFLGGTTAGHLRQGAEDQMEMIAEFRPELDVDGEQAGQLFFADEDPVPAVGEVLPVSGVPAVKKGAADTAVPAVEDSLTILAQQLRRA